MKNILIRFAAAVMFCFMFALLIPGKPAQAAVSGQGTKESPYRVYNYTDLRTLLATSGDMHIRLNSTIEQKDSDNGNYLTVASGNKTLDLYGYSLKREATTVDEVFFDVKKNADLTIRNTVKDSESNIFMMNYKGWTDLMYVQEGAQVTLGSVYGDKIKLDMNATSYSPLESSPVVQVIGNMTMYDGVSIVGKYCSLSAGSSAGVCIYGGEFYHGLNLVNAKIALVFEATIYERIGFSISSITIPSLTCIASESVVYQNGQEVGSKFKEYDDGFGLDANDTVTTVVWEAAPYKLVDPVDDETYANGSYVTYSAGAVGADSYEWCIYEPGTGTDRDPISWATLERHCTHTSINDSSIKIFINTGDMWLNQMEVYCIMTNKYGSTTSKPAAINVLPYPMEYVEVTGLDEPVVGKEPDYSITVEGLPSYKDPNDIFTWQEVTWYRSGTNGILEKMAVGEKFQAGERYSCKIALSTTQNGWAFPYKVYTDPDYGDEYYIFKNPFKINGVGMTAYIYDNGKTLEASGWWGKEAKASGSGQEEPGNSTTKETIKATLSYTSVTYNGKVKTPTVTVKNEAGKTLVNNTDYTVSYESGRKNVGKYNVTVTFKGKYSGAETLSFKINPKGTSIKSLSKGKKCFTVKWKKQSTKMASSRITGYQVRYSLKKKFTSGVKTKTVKGYKKTSVKISKLKSRKTYYVQVRTYKTVNKQKYYSAWSKTKAVKTK